jgi:hypothetical protein
MGAFTLAAVDDGEVAYVQSAVRGMVTNDKKELLHLNNLRESICSQALPVGMSRDLIMRTADERWT